MRLETLDIDQDLRYEMIRGRPDLWIKEDQRRERVVDVVSEYEKLELLLAETRAVRVATGHGAA